jgi:ABC-2 type transport system ATP-binding protein
MANGLLKPDAGSIRVAGLDPVTQHRQLHEQVGYMPQQFALYGDLSVAENLEFYALAYGLSSQRRRERIPRLLNFAGLESFHDRLGAHLSGGMRKKLALACMLIFEPSIVFLDEPTLGVDPVSRREFWSLLSNLRVERGLTIFVCTPYMDEAERCHRVGLLYDGRLIAQGTPASIKGMVGGEMLEIRTTDLCGAQKVLAGLPGVLETQTYGDQLHVLVDSAPLRAAMVRQSLLATGLTPVDVFVSEPRMEEAFVSLIRRQARRDATPDRS